MKSRISMLRDYLALRNEAHRIDQELLRLNEESNSLYHRKMVLESELVNTLGDGCYLFLVDGSWYVVRIDHSMCIVQQAEMMDTPNLRFDPLP